MELYKKLYTIERLNELLFLQTLHSQKPKLFPLFLDKAVNPPNWRDKLSCGKKSLVKHWY